jgi:hypothetical protein
LAALARAELLPVFPQLRHVGKDKTVSEALNGPAARAFCTKNKVSRDMAGRYDMARAVRAVEHSISA